MKNYDKLKSHKLAKENMRFQKKKIFILLAVFLAVFLLFSDVCYSQDTTRHLTIKNYNENTSFIGADQSGTIGIKINNETKSGIYQFSFNCIRADATLCQYDICIASTFASSSCLQYAVNNTQCGSTQMWSPYRDVISTSYKFNPPYVMEANTDYWLLFVGTNICTSFFYGTSNINLYDYETYRSGELQNNFDLASQIMTTTTPEIIASSTGECPDCTNNCFCGGISGATTSTSSIITDTFLDDNDISTIKSVSGVVDNKNYTIYYFPFLLFIYIFIILIVCLLVIYIFKIIRKK